MPQLMRSTNTQEKLNALYEELCWGHDDELIFTHDGTRVIVYNKTLQDRKK